MRRSGLTICSVQDPSNTQMVLGKERTCTREKQQHSVRVSTQWQDGRFSFCNVVFVLLLTFDI